MSDAPTFSVVRGNPTAEELAAVVGVLVGISNQPSAAPVRPQPNAWWASGLPVRPTVWRAWGRPA
jgi:Acyl-CoA carboxylase epsilon subunit